MAPDEKALRADLDSLRFKNGVERGKWELKGIDFPYALFYISAANILDAPKGFLLRSECSGYRATAPTSQLWHGKLDAALEEVNRPRTSQGVMECFSNWNPCLYHPIDRIGATHWPNDHLDQRWTPDRDITFLLETVYGFFHRSDYVGATLPAEALEVPASYLGKSSSRT